MNDSQNAFLRLSDILDTLRHQCPWDRTQTFKSLRYLTIEEVHELSDAIIEREELNRQIEIGDIPNSSAQEQLSLLNSQLKKELGDLAMHILFYCKLAEEQGLFTTADVYNSICDKLIDRHPFIYEKESYNGESWEQLKMREGRTSELDGVPQSLPSVIKAQRMQEKVAGTHKHDKTEWKIDNPDCESLLSSIGNPISTEEQFGDLLFALIDWGRRHSFNADDALCAANLRFKDSVSGKQ